MVMNRKKNHAWDEDELMRGEKEMEKLFLRNVNLLFPINAHLRHILLRFFVDFIDKILINDERYVRGRVIVIDSHMFKYYPNTFIHHIA